MLEALASSDEVGNYMNNLTVTFAIRARLCQQTLPRGESDSAIGPIPSRCFEIWECECQISPPS